MQVSAAEDLKQDDSGGTGEEKAIDSYLGDEKVLRLGDCRGREASQDWPEGPYLGPGMPPTGRQGERVWGKLTGSTLDTWNVWWYLDVQVSNKAAG